MSLVINVTVYRITGGKSKPVMIMLFMVERIYQFIVNFVTMVIT